MDTTHRIRAHFADSAELKLAAVDAMAPLIARAAGLMTDCLLADGKILACGNGGSASDAQHFAAEMVGRFERERPELPALSLATDTSILTAVANEYDFSDWPAMPHSTRVMQTAISTALSVLMPPMRSDT